jgi:RNA polymerase sigma factor (sigma-70 family)
LRERFPSVEADDVIQETFTALFFALPSYKYAPEEKGHFHNYLTGILRNKAARAIRKRIRDGKLLDEYAKIAPPEPSDEEKEKWKDSVFETAKNLFFADESIADRTKRIFERIAIKRESPEAVAAAFKMKRHAVDQAKCRAMSRLREIVEELESVDNER